MNPPRLCEAVLGVPHFFVDLKTHLQAVPTYAASKPCSGISARHDRALQVRGNRRSTIRYPILSTVLMQPSASSATAQSIALAAPPRTTSTWSRPLSIAELDVCAPIDANGNLTSDGARTFGWFADNRFATVSMATTNWQFSYDAIGRRQRLQETVGGVGTIDNRFVWGDGVILEERPSAGPVRKVLAMGEYDTASRFGAQDHLMSIREITSSQGDVLTRVSYDPFGLPTLENGTQLMMYGFGGLGAGPGGLQLGVHRAFDPSAGRWISEDPIGIKGGLNLYGYSGNMPIGSTDPSGLIPIYIGGGKGDCSYYDRKCSEQTNACTPKEGNYYCEAGQCCRDFPDTVINRCVRRCLVTVDRSGMGPAGAHVICYTSCAKVDIWNTPASCLNVSAVGRLRGRGRR